MRARNQPLNIIVIDEWLPYPVNNGKKLRSFNLLSPLARKHHITYIAPRSRDGKQDATAKSAMQDAGFNVVWVDRPVPLNSGPLFAARLAMNLASSVPYSVQRHTSRRMRDIISSIILREPIDLLHVEWTPYVVNLPVDVRSPVVVNAHNIESLIWQRYYEEERNTAKSWYIQRQWTKFERFERKAFLKANCVVTTTEQDAHLAQAEFSARKVEVVDNGVDISRFGYVTEGRDPHNLLFLGSLDWRPNIDAVRWLLSSIFASILKREPKAQLTIVGLNPPGWLIKDVAARPAVSLYGNVPDVRPYLEKCGTLLVPLRVGGGSRIKILEAMASGCPVVSTSIGAEGLHFEHDQHYLAADNEHDFANAVVRAIREPDTMQSMSAAARNAVCERYSWDLLADRLHGVWTSQVATSELVTA